MKMLIDSFIFFNELDILEIRLNTLDPHVDKFLIVESETTFQGNSKSLHFWLNRHRFFQFREKIIHVVAPLPAGNSYEDGWNRESAARNAVAIGLKDASDDAILMLSDADEIPNLAGWDSKTPTVWSHNFFYYFVNLTIGQIKGTVATSLKQFRNDPDIGSSGQKLRDWRHNVQRVRRGPLGGWHFSYLGGVDAIKEKIMAFAHSELVGHANDENIREALSSRWRKNIDLFNRKNLYEFKLVDDDASLPPFLVENKDRFCKCMEHG